MKWSSPLPHVECYFDSDPYLWVLGFGISFPDSGYDKRGFHIYLGPLLFSFCLTWPERSRP